jgi:hypothetical protein
MTYPNDPAPGGPGPAPQYPPPSSPPPAAPPPGRPQPDPGAAFNEALADLKGRGFSTAELLMAAGGLLVLAVFVLFGVLLNTYYDNDVIFAASGVLVFVIVAQRLGLWDFGSGYKGLVIVLGFLLALMLVNDVLYAVRTGQLGASNGTGLIGRIIEWVGQAVAAAGAYMFWRGGRA